MRSDILIRFNWDALLKLSLNHCHHALDVVKCLYGLKMPTKRELSIIRKLPKDNRTCWLNDPVKFFTSRANAEDMCIYLHIASKRDYFLYKTTGTTGVPTYIVEDLYDIDKLKSNILLKNENEMIELLY